MSIKQLEEESESYQKALEYLRQIYLCESCYKKVITKDLVNHLKEYILRTSKEEGKNESN